MDNFYNTFIYFFNVVVLNNPEFQKIANEIYPKEATINKHNISTDHNLFIGLDFKIKQGCLCTRIDDKGTIFLFL